MLLTALLVAAEAIGIAPKPESEWHTFEATAYTANCRGCSGITKSGVDVRKTTEHGGRTVIAVDPRVIPLGSAVEIRLDDGTIIEGTAEDVGGAIKGARIDILHGSRSAAIEFGRQKVELRIINKNKSEGDTNE
ncbi:3D domain-containing protein [Paenibacillus pinihumi]|uniref:3D domain-containing protein n=1 Tax=Paenibacillus pinihumi TaxID=669462 RepID=UPI0006853B7B|nr:3D domain-containing protein [Paenibacillus pinihumi]